MFSFATLLVLAAASTSVSAHSISHVHRRHGRPSQAPSGWATGYLEKYADYHARYMSIGCEHKHNTSFFGFCCHPLLATETVQKNRPACCAIGSTAACPDQSKPVVSNGSKSNENNNGDDEDCEDDDESNNNPDDEEEECDDDEGNADEGEEEDCEEEGDDKPAAKPSSSTSPNKATPTVKPTVKATSSSIHSTPQATPPAQTSAAPAKTPKPSPTTASTPTKTPSSSNSNGNGNGIGTLISGGVATWFDQNNNAGACGKVHQDTDFVVALQTSTYAKGVNCGRKIRIIDASTGKSVDGVVADECPTCLNTESIDLSRGMFQALRPLSVGEFSIKWEFLAA